MHDSPEPSQMPYLRMDLEQRTVFPKSSTAFHTLLRAGTLLRPQAERADPEEAIPFLATLSAAAMALGPIR